MTLKRQKHGLRTLSAWLSPNIFAFVACKCGWQSSLHGAWNVVSAIKRDLRALFEAHLVEAGEELKPEDAGEFE